MSETGDYGQRAGALSKAANLVTDAKGDFTSLSSTLSGEITAMQGKWGGQGATAFFNLHNAWNEKQRKVVDALDDFAESLTMTERRNVETDEQQSSNMKNLIQKLN